MSAEFASADAIRGEEWRDIEEGDWVLVEVPGENRYDYTEVTEVPEDTNMFIRTKMYPTCTGIGAVFEVISGPLDYRPSYSR